MSNERANVALLERGYKAWHDSKGGSIDTWLPMFADATRFWSMAEGAHTLAFTQERKSRDEVRHYLTALTAEWSMIHFTIERYVAQEDAVAVFCSTAWRNKRTGKVAETQKVDFWRFKDGKAVEFREYYDTAKLLAAAS